MFEDDPKIGTQERDPQVRAIQQAFREEEVRRQGQAIVARSEVQIDAVDEEVHDYSRAVAERPFSKPEGMSDASWAAACQEVSELQAGRKQK